MASKAAKSPSTRREIPLVAVLSAATLSVAGHVLGKALRDTLFLATFPIETLPYFLLATGVLSGTAVSITARLNAALSPGRAVPLVAATAAVSMPLLWIGARGGAPWAIAVLYVWTSISTGLLVSGFWTVFSERFDPRTARQMFGLVGAGTTAGGLVGGLGAHALLRFLDTETLLLPLSFVDLLLALAINRLAFDGQAPRPSPSGGRVGLRKGTSAVVRSPYLRDIALLIMIFTIAGTLSEYVFKDAASRTLRTKRELAEFFALFHGAVGAVTLGVQILACRPLVAKKGLAAALSALPAWFVLGASAVLSWPVLWTATALRGGENAVRNSFHRAGYELLFVPLPPAEKRAVKPILDLLVDRLADAVGALLVLALIALGVRSDRFGFGIIGLSIVGAFMTARVRAGYVSTLSASLVARAVELRDMVRVAEDDATARKTIRSTLMDVRRSGLMQTMSKSRLGITLMKSVELDVSRAGGGDQPQSPAPSPALTRENAREHDERASQREQVESLESSSSSSPSSSSQDPLLSILRDLKSSDRRVVIAAIDRWDGVDRSVAAFLVKLLGRDDLENKAIAALARAGDKVTGLLADHLSDPSEHHVIRRRIPRILATTSNPLTMEILETALLDGLFEVRYHAAVAIERLRTRGKAVSPDRIWAALRSEVKKSRAMWEAERLIDLEGHEDPLLAGVVARRGAHSLRHVFRLLGLVLDSKALELSYRAVHARDAHFRAVGLEYLENVLPPDIRGPLWPLIGDDDEEPPPLSRRSRALSEVVEELRGASPPSDTIPPRA